MPYKFMFPLLFLVTALVMDLYAQSYPGRRLVSCQQENISFSDFFRIVYEQTQMQAFYNEEQLSSDDRISVYFQNEPLDNVLALLIRKRGMGWCYKQETFVISFKKRGEADLGELPEEKRRTIIGVVVNEKSEPLDAVSIMVKGSHKGTNTYKDGKFILSDLKKDAKLSVRRTGYKSMELVSYADSIYVQLIPMIAPLREVNVNGIVQNTLTGSASGMKSKDIADQPVANVMSALQGRIPGLYINQTTGLPGGGYRIRLRGKNSIESISDPLVLVDGIPFPSVSFNENYVNMVGNGTPLGANVAASPLNLLSINDIDNIEILKDADATALYGSRGANGVILINSKLPQVGEKGFTVNFYKGIGKAANLVRYLDTRQYVRMRLEGIRNDGSQPGPRDYDLNVWDTTRYTDWQKTMIGGTASITDGSLEFKGGNTNTYYRVSGLYRQESTVYPSENFKYKKGGAMMQGSFRSNNQKFKASLSASYVADHNLLPATDLTTFSTLPPNTPSVYINDKELNFTFNNPYSHLLRTYRAKSQNLRTNMDVKFEPVTHLVFKVSMGFNTLEMDEVQIRPAKSYDPAIGRKGESYFNSNNYHNAMLNFQGSWQKNFGKEQFSLIAGARFQKDDQLQKNYYGYDYSDDALLEDTAAAGNLDLLGSIDTTFSYQSLYARLEYKHEDKYVITMTGSRDGSTRLSPSKRYGTFGSLGGAWIFSREKWLRKSKVFSFGKLRGSYGITGNDQYVRNIDRDTYVPYSLLSERGSAISRSDYHPRYSWEKIRKAELAVDLGFLNDQLLATICYYHNRSTDQLLTGRYSSIDGIKNIPVNFAAVVENKGFEFDLETAFIKRKKISWSSTFNLSFPKNKLLSFPDLRQTGYRFFYNLGMSLDMVQNYHLIGIDPGTGVYNFVGSEHNGPTEEDKIFGKEIGPVFYGGFQNNICYKGFELSIFIRFAKQTNYDYQYAFGPNSPGTIGNQPLTVLNRWQRPGDQAALQRFTGSMSTDAGQAFTFALFGDQRITDASYARLQSLSLSYYLSSKFLKRIKIKSCKLYLQALNLFTLTNYKGRDPEIVTSMETYPPLRITTAGIQFSF